jgi:hypothetical protein
MREYQMFLETLTEIWSQVGERILRAQTREEIESVLHSLPMAPNPIALMTIQPLLFRLGDLLSAMRDENFPQCQRAAQLRFIAKFLACGTEVSTRTFDRHYSTPTKRDTTFDLHLFEP